MLTLFNRQFKIITSQLFKVYINQTCVYYCTLSDMELKSMHEEINRLESFKDNWPHTFLTAKDLSKNGFYYLNRGDEVRCAFCNVEFMKWEDNDDPAEFHKKWAPRCPFVIKKEQMKGPAQPRYSTVEARLKTFTDWPASMTQKPLELAEAGFYYTNKGDRTKCYYCDNGLKDWEPEDVPWEQHARWFDKCEFVKIVKGDQYVQKVISEACVIKPKAEIKPDNKESNDQLNETLCKICFVNERDVCFLPCGHVVACATCALSLVSKRCPVCNNVYDLVKRLYYN
ncbi:IAP-3 [Choristoneura occidentalis granulovirus]|uniref:IAP-3 n=2 Tax=Betabaculovirus chofumiferanae TaxID=3051997 RepID=Q1A4L2_9BBAC|nr:IAP-3 [Choristoneura fumiferana granulovirus]ABC61218.1 IAP-3 [Choristoneura fumiferana granulovirus]